MKVHVPVLAKEVVEYLRPKPGDYIVDCTLGGAGHTKEILKRIVPGGFLIGLDLDEEAIKISEDNLKEFKGAFMLLNFSFRNISKLPQRVNMDRKFNGILFDLGFSSLQIGSKERGFSFNLESPLDMRFDKKADLSAFEVVNKLPKEELEKIIRTLGQERFSNRIANAIVTERRKQRILTTTLLADIIKKAVPFSGRIHPATRTFQAIRMFINSELDSLREGLEGSMGLLAPEGRLCVISFHSLEDRLVKHTLRDFSKRGLIEILTKKPLRPSREEIAVNPSSRSAKLRAAQRVADNNI